MTKITITVEADSPERATRYADYAVDTACKIVEDEAIHNALYSDGNGNTYCVNVERRD